MHLVLAKKSWELGKGLTDPRYVPKPEDPMEVIMDMLYPDVGPGITKEELDMMPPPQAAHSWTWLDNPGDTTRSAGHSL